MAYPEKVLADDEQVVEHLHPHWITLVPATLWFLVICFAGGAASWGATKTSGVGEDILLGVIIVVGVVLLIWLSFAPWIRWRSTHFVLTTHRVLIRRGVLRHTGRDISLQRISDVGFSRSLWDRMVGAGTLTIESASEHGQEELKNVPHSDLVQQTLNRLIEQDSDRRNREALGGGFPQGGYPQQGYPQQQYPTQQQYPQTQYPQTQYPQQQYPPTQQYPPGQYPTR